MYKYATTQLFCSFPKGIKRWITKVFCIYIRSYLQSRHFQLLHAALHFLNGHIDILQRHSTYANKTIRMQINTLSNMIIKKTCCFQSMLWLRPVIKKYGDSGKHLHTYFRHVHFLQACLGIPAILFSFANYFIPFYNLCTPGLLMLQMYKFTIAKLLEPVRYALGHDVCVNIYLFH